MPLKKTSRNALPENNLAAQFCTALPPLPSALRYYDEFDNCVRSILNPAESPIFEIYVHGGIHKIDFGSRGRHTALIFKHTLAMMFEHGLSPVSIAAYYSVMHHLADDDIDSLLKTGPLEIGLLWSSWRARNLQRGTLMLGKHLLHLLCTYRWNGWSDDYRSFLGTTLPYPESDPYAAVRSGNAFLSANEEASIVRYLDEMAANLSKGVSLPYSSVADAGMLLCAFQFGLRPVQIAMLTLRHVRIWQDGIEVNPTVHLTFHMAKQRGKKNRIPLTRRVKREWSSIFVHLQTALNDADTTPPPKFFLARSANEVSRRIASLARGLVDTGDFRSATDLRHTAAQRLVDAGASHEELAEFLGHAHTHTGMVYFATAASHAERVNRALGASTVYRQVAKIAHDKFISPEELATLKDEQQIAGAPHGTAIAGIGGCKSGQPGCPYNPIFSCYGCRKFMPTTDLNLHKQVLMNMREVVLIFERSSRGDVTSPAYMQLQRTIGEIQTVIGELDGSKK